MKPSHLTRRRLFRTILLLVAALLASMAWSLSIGFVKIGIASALRPLWGGVTPPEHLAILFQLRLPRILLAALAGYLLWAKSEAAPR